MWDGTNTFLHVHADMESETKAFKELPLPFFSWKQTQDIHTVKSGKQKQFNYVF